MKKAKESIVDAAVEVPREGGASAIDARSVALNLTDAELLASFRWEFAALAGCYGVSPVSLKLRRQEEQ